MEDIISYIEDGCKSSALVVGVGGLDCSGKTTFARDLLNRLSHHSINLLHIDDYNDMAVQKQVYMAHKAGKFTAELADLYYRKSIDYEAAVQAITASQARYDITIIEGVFLFKDSLAPLLDIRIFLNIEPSVARARYAQRREQSGDNRPLTVFDDIWLPAHERYMRQTQPRDRSDFIC